MAVDDRALGGLVEESQDLHTDAMRGTQAARDEIRDLGASRRGGSPGVGDMRRHDMDRRSLLRTGGLGLAALASSGLFATAFGSRARALARRPAQAEDVDVNVQIFQTAASLENLAVATYGIALGLSFIQENPILEMFARTTMGQHDEHAAAFNAMAVDLGGARQDGTNPKYTPVVDAAKPSLLDALAVVQLATTLEQVATETYQANLTMLGDGNLRTLMGSVLGVESQHLAILREVGGLFQAGAPQLVAIPTDVPALPAMAGSIAFPNPFGKIDMASPPTEGAIQ